MNKSTDNAISKSDAAAYILYVIFIFAPVWLYNREGFFSNTERLKVLLIFTLIACVAGSLCGWLFVSKRKPLAAICGALSGPVYVGLFSYFTFYSDAISNNELIVAIAVAGMCLGIFPYFLVLLVFYKELPTVPGSFNGD